MQLCVRQSASSDQLRILRSAAGQNRHFFKYIHVHVYAFIDLAFHCPVSKRCPGRRNVEELNNRG